jgi:hypothetical protein
VRIVLEALQLREPLGDGSKQTATSEITQSPQAVVANAASLAGSASASTTTGAPASSDSADGPASKAATDYAAELAAVKALAGALIKHPQTAQLTSEKTSIAAQIVSAAAQAQKNEWSAAIAHLGAARDELVAAQELADTLGLQAAAPAAADVQTQSGELSGGQWVARFPGSADIADCRDPFKSRLARFVAALRAAGAAVTINATFRPVQRAYLMHWCWMIVKQDADTQAIPAMSGVNIVWTHPTVQASKAAAREMVTGYGIASLGTPPALSSKHTVGLAVDMSISWSGTLNIANEAGQVTAIISSPRSGMNGELADVGASFGVIKYNGSGVDRPHWSDTGN